MRRSDSVQKNVCHWACTAQNNTDAAAHLNRFCSVSTADTFCNMLLDDIKILHHVRYGGEHAECVPVCVQSSETVSCWLAANIVERIHVFAA